MPVTVEFNPQSTSKQAAIIPDASSKNAGVMTPAQAGRVAGGAQLGEANTWTASQNVASVPLTDDPSILTDASLGNVFTVTLGGNRTLANPTNLVSGATYLWVIDNGTGSHSLAYGDLFTWPGGSVPTLTTTAGAVDVISAVYDGLKLRAAAQLAFS